MTEHLTDYWPRELLDQVATFFRQREVDAYVVGGTVRDWLLGQPSQDLDLAVEGDALVLTRELADELDAAYVPLDIERETARAVLVGAGLGARPGQDGTEFPTAAPGPDHVYIDVAKLRGGTLSTDLADRDFTVNAMAIDLEDAVAGQLDIVDPFNGRNDLRAGRLRATSEAALRDDPLRLLRALRLAAQLDFAIEPQTQRWIAEQSAAIVEPSPERVRDELVRLFARPGTAGYLRLMDDLGLLAPLWPELVAGKGVEQPSIHKWDVYEHLLVTVEWIDRILGALDIPPFTGLANESGGEPDLNPVYTQVRDCLSPFVPELRTHLLTRLVGGRPRFVLLKLLVLLHDVGKPRTRSVDEGGEIHFHRHAQVGADMVRAILRRLHFGGREVKIGRTVTLHHMRPKWLAVSEKVTSRAVYRFFRDTRESGVDVVLLSLADTLAKDDAPKADAVEWAAQLDITFRLLKAWFERRDRIVDPPTLVRGSELIERFDLEPGPIVGELLEVIREAQVTDRVSTRDEVFALAREWLVEKHGTEFHGSSLGK